MSPLKPLSEYAVNAKQEADAWSMYLSGDERAAPGDFRRAPHRAKASQEGYGCGHGSYGEGCSKRQTARSQGVQ